MHLSKSAALYDRSHCSLFTAAAVRYSITIRSLFSLQDDFNLTGLNAHVHIHSLLTHHSLATRSLFTRYLQVPYYDNALDVILDMESPNGHYYWLTHY